MLMYHTGSEKIQGGDATLSRRCDGDGLCCELLIKISRVRLRGNLGLKRWDQLLKQSTHGNISVLSHSCPPVDNLQGFPGRHHIQESIQPEPPGGEEISQPVSLQLKLPIIKGSATSFNSSTKRITILRA